eukprot:14232023-Ditylum_brightwellii.AAC.1
MGGVGLTTGDCEQGVEKIITVSQQVRAKTSVGDQCQIALASAQLQVGISYAILEHLKHLPYLEGKWISTFMCPFQYLKRHHIPQETQDRHYQENKRKVYHESCAPVKGNTGSKDLANELLLHVPPTADSNLHQLI